MSSRRTGCVLACAMVTATWTCLAALQTSADTGAVRVELPAASSERADRLAETARLALALFTEWVGDAPAPTLTIAEVPWRSPVMEPTPGRAAIRPRRLELERDPAAERRLIAAIASHYWHDPLSRPADQRWFAEALVRYLAARAIDTIIGGRQYWSSRSFGGFIPYATRLPLSPSGANARGHVLLINADVPLRADSDQPRVRRAIVALFTLERLIGWPALQQGLHTYRARAVSHGYAPPALAAVLSEQRGHDLRWFFDEALLGDRQFDYGIESLTTATHGSRVHVRLDLRRFGDAVFGTDGAPRGASLPVVVEFADGSRVIEHWHGSRPTVRLEFTAVTSPVRATVDPDALLLLDGNRANNVWRSGAAPATSVSVRATLAWLTWLEDLVVSCLALV